MASRAGTRGGGLLDARVLLDACGGDGATLERMCSIFRARLPPDMAEVVRAHRERDPARLRDAAHKLASVLAVFSSAAGALASDLEDHSARGELVLAAPLIEELEHTAEELRLAAAGISIEKLAQAAPSRGRASPPASG